jgi:TctA family transporter
MMERSLFRSLVMSQGDVTILVTRPISLTFLVLALLILLSFSWRAIRPVRAAKPVD